MLLANSTSIKGMEKLINEFFYSTDYKVNSNLKLENIKKNESFLQGLNQKFEIKQVKSKYQFHSVETTK